MPRKRKQTGHVYKRNGWWVLRKRERVCVGGELKERQPAVQIARIDEHHPTKASVQSLIEEAIRETNNRNRNPYTVTTVRDFVSRIYLPSVKQYKRPSTYKGYKDMWEDHLDARCGDHWLRDVRTYDVQNWLDSIAREDKLGKTSLKHHKHFLSGVFRYAKQQDYFDGANPVTSASIPEARSAGETYAYSIDEIKRMLAVLTEPAVTVVAVAAFTGLRRGEIRGLLWENYVPAVDGGMATLQVTRSVWNRHVGEPKTERSKAPVPVIAPLARMLDVHRLRCGNPVSGPIFANSFGRPLDLEYVQRTVIAEAFYPEKQPPIVEWHGWHAFRRGLATNLNRLGVDDKVIQAILRHSNITTTQNIYIKSVPADSVAAMKQLESLMCANCAPAEQSVQPPRPN